MIPTKPLLPLAALLFLSSCISLPEVDAPQTEVRFMAPSETTYTNGTLTLQLEVVGTPPDKVELLIGDDQVLAELSSPYAYEWDTTSSPEGRHLIRGRALAAGGSFTSAPLEVVVDRTPPQLDSRTPTPSAQDVWVQQPIQATFSEPVRANTLTDTSVRLSLGDLDIARTISLSNDGRTLTVSPSSKLSAPNTVAVTLTTSITDLAGNMLVLPTDSWSWMLPFWLTWSTANEATVRSQSDYLGSFHLTDTGELFGAWHILEGSTLELYARYWEDGTWKPLGGALGAYPGNTSIDSATFIFDTAAKPIIAWSEADETSSYNIHVRRWQTDHWDPLGSTLSAYPGQTNAYGPRLSLDQSGAPVIAWTEFDGTTSKICLRRWQAESWQPLGECFDDLTQNQSLDDKGIVVRFDASNKPVVAWTVSGTPTRFFVQRLEPAGWRFLGDGLTTDEQAPYIALQIDANGTPFIATNQNDSATYNISVESLVETEEDSYWGFVGDLSAFPGKTPTASRSIEFDNLGNPVVAFVEYDGLGRARLQAYRNANGIWSSLSGELSSEENTGFVYLERTASNNLLLIWRHGDNLRVRRLNQ